MRSITLTVLVCLFAVAQGYYMTKDVKYADEKFLVKQKAILEIFQHVHQPELHTHLWDDAKAYDVESNLDHYTNVVAVKDFIRLYKHGLLPMEEIFSVYHEEHLEEVIALFHLFYYAKDWETFYKTMVWARFHVNEGMFVYALTVAVLHRQDMAGIVLPAPYEIYPYYFFDEKVISKAQRYKMQGFYGMKKVEDVYTAIIPTNYTRYYAHVNPEQKIAYFTEDIGLNSYYYYFHADYPFWMGGQEYGLKNDRRGEFYLYQHQQFLARYYLERLSNDMGLIKEFTYDMPLTTGYYPSLRYYNGVSFPMRHPFYKVYTTKTAMLETIEDYERRILEAIDRGYIILPDGSHYDITKPTIESIEALGNLIQGNKDSKNTRLYGYLLKFCKMYLGGSMTSIYGYETVPSTLENYETAMRDPMFYKLYKRVMHWFSHYTRMMPTYKKDELTYPGVKIENVVVDKLVTYFDKFDADITNAVDIEVFDEKTMKPSELKKFGKMAHYQGEDFVIKARQPRLNHLPFKVTLNVVSDKPQKAVVKMFLGPKYDTYGRVYGVNENRENFYELEHYIVDLVAGKNVIQRNSADFSWFVQDRTTYFDLYKHVMLAMKGAEKFPLDMTEAHCGFPQRLMLPKGKKGGMVYQMYFFIYKYEAPATPAYTGYDSTISCGVGSGARYVDALPFGFPFNRKIDESQWFTPNMYYQDTLIYHKTEYEVNHTLPL